MRKGMYTWRVLQAWISAMFVIFLLVISGCSAEQTTGAEDVRWDRETCERCRMTVSDRLFSAQVRGGAGQQHKVYKFDDIGCAVVWLDQQDWKDEPDVEIWVNEQNNGKWINARTARFTRNNNTPMAYGLGAQVSDNPALLNFSQARAHIYEIEKKYNLHNGEPHPEPPVVEKPE